MSARYKFEPTRSRNTVQAFASGMLSVFAHSPTFAVRDFTGELGFAGENSERMLLDLTIAARSLELVDRVSSADRREIEEKLRQDVLEVSTYPEIQYQSGDVTAEPISRVTFRLRIDGQLSLHGVTRAHQVEAEFQVFADGVRLSGGCSLRLSEYRIRPVTALGGTIRLKDDLKVSFDLAGLPEAS